MCLGYSIPSDRLGETYGQWAFTFPASPVRSRERPGALLCGHTGLWTLYPSPGKTDQAERPTSLYYVSAILTENSGIVGAKKLGLQLSEVVVWLPAALCSLSLREASDRYRRKIGPRQVSQCQTEKGQLEQHLAQNRPSITICELFSETENVRPGFKPFHVLSTRAPQGGGDWEMVRCSRCKCEDQDLDPQNPPKCWVGTPAWEMQRRGGGGGIPHNKWAS